jgi:hypothetical protein
MKETCSVTSVKSLFHTGLHADSSQGDHSKEELATDLLLAHFDDWLE